jgi:hypothetical protein
MNAIEAVEALKSGFHVIAFRPESSTTAKELFKFREPNVIELYLADSTKSPADVMSETMFLKSYPNTVVFQAYNT